ALGVRRALEDVDTAVIRADRRVLERLIAGKIAFSDDAAVRLQKCRGVLRDLTAIERIRPLRRDGPERSREIPVHEHVAHLERPAVLEPHLHRRWTFLELV